MSNKVATIGDNNPPEPTPFEVAQEKILVLYQQAQDYLDGDPITTEGQAEDVQTLMRLIQQEQKSADAQRKAEAKPFDDGKKAIQEKYNPLIQKGSGKCDLAINACKKALTPWQIAQEEIRQAAAEKLRREAEEKQRIAAEENRKARESSDLKAREEADRKIKEADNAAKAAAKLEKATVKTTGAGRAVSLRTRHIAEVTDYTAAGRHMWAAHKDEFHALIADLAQKDVTAGKRDIPGVTVKEERTVA